MRSAVGAVMTGTFSFTERAIWVDPSDLSIMRQEITGASASTPVVSGDPVGSILNKGAVGGWLTAPSTGARPILRTDGGGRYYLEFDGSNDSLEFTATQTDVIEAQPFGVFAAWSFTAGGTQDYILGATGGLAVGWADAATLAFAYSSNDILFSLTRDTGPHVHTAIQSAVGRTLRQDGSTASTSDANTTYLTPQTGLAIGVRNGAFTEAHFYGLMIEGGTISNSLRDLIEQRLAAAIGITFTS